MLVVEGLMERVSRAELFIPSFFVRRKRLEPDRKREHISAPFVPVV